MRCMHLITIIVFTPQSGQTSFTLVGLVVGESDGLVVGESVGTYDIDMTSREKIKRII